MAQITAQLVPNELRSKTGQGMMECKKMLTEVGGDIDKAIDAFRKKGVKASISQRAATEGRVAGAFLSRPTARRGPWLKSACNTDFTARSAPLVGLADRAAKMLLADPSLDLTKDASLVAAASTGLAADRRKRASARRRS